MPKNNNIVLGEFWVDSDGEVFIDITDPVKSLEDAARFDAIKRLQQKLDRQPPLITPLKHRNRPKQAHSKSKGY